MNINYLVWPRAGPGRYNRVYSKYLFSCRVTDIMTLMDMYININNIWIWPFHHLFLLACQMVLLLSNFRLHFKLSNFRLLFKTLLKLNIQNTSKPMSHSDNSDFILCSAAVLQSASGSSSAPSHWPLVTIKLQDSAVMEAAALQCGYHINFYSCTLCSS